jgi:hypothetical protein
VSLGPITGKLIAELLSDEPLSRIAGLGPMLRTSRTSPPIRRKLRESVEPIIGPGVPAHATSVLPFCASMTSAHGTRICGVASLTTPQKIQAFVDVEAINHTA